MRSSGGVQGGNLEVIDGAYQHRALERGSAVQRFWHHSKLALLEWLLPIEAGEQALDVGCGSGVFADAMARHGADVVAVDGNRQAVAYAQKTFGRPGLRFEFALIGELGQPPGTFDMVSCLEVIEHVPPPEARKLIREIHRLLTPGGRLLLTTPNYRGLWPAIEWSADRVSSITGVAKMGGHQHVSRFHRRSLRDLLAENGFEVLQLRTFSTFAPFSAVLAWSVALRVERLERRVDLPFGSLLAAVAAKR